MGAAKRLYDNSYIEHQETAASAVAYLAAVKNNDNNKNKKRGVIKSQSSVICSIITIVTSIIYSVLILVLILLPLIKETEIHKVKVSFSTYKSEILRLETEIGNTRAEFDEKIKLSNIEQMAREKLGLRKPDEKQIIHLVSDSYYFVENYSLNTDIDDIAEVDNSTTD